MKAYFLFSGILFSQILFGTEISYQLNNSNEGCKNNPIILLIDNNSDNHFEYFIYSGCKEKARILNLNDNAESKPEKNLKAILLNGVMNDNNFKIYLMDSVNLKYTHILYCNGFEPVILEDYRQNSNELEFLESADNYFHIKQLGNMIIVTKILDLHVYSITLNDIRGNELMNRVVHSSEGRYYIDFKKYPSGLYLLQFLIYDEKANQNRLIVKKLIFIN